MRPSWPQIDLAKIANTLESVRSGFVTPAARALNDVRKILSNGMTFADNMNAAWVEFEAKHGTEARVANPLNGIPRAFIPVDALTLSALGGRLTGTKQTLITQPLLNTQRTDGFLGIRVQYDLAHEQPSLIRTASAVQSIAAAGGDKQLTGWDTTESSRGSVISDNGALFTVSEAGSYLVVLLVRFQSGATYTKCEATIRAAGVNHGDSFVPAPMTDGGYFTCSAILRLAAGGTFDTSVFQDNAAAAARNVLSGASTGRRIAIHRLYNDTTPAARVRGILVGG